MNEGIMIELRFFGTSIIWGIILLILYDLIRILRRVVKHNNFFVALQDVIYWVTSSVLIFHMMYQQNNGIIRGFSILAMLLGMVLYHATVSGPLVNVISRVIIKMKASIGKLIKIVLMPFRFLLHKIFSIFVWLFSIVKKLKQFFVKSLKKGRKSSKIETSENEKGD